LNISPLDSALLSPLLSDAETAELFSDGATVQAMLDFECALARVEEQLGVIPADSAKAITAAAETLTPDWQQLGEGSRSAGHPVAALVEQLRKAAGAAGDHAHYGATAQDVVDTALVLRLRTALDVLHRRLSRLIGTLCERAAEYRQLVMPARTRYQQAVPTTFGLKVANWLQPLVRHRQRLAELRPRVLVVQLGGAAGTLSVLGERGVEVMESLAEELDLAAPATPWHTQRDGLVELAGWLSLVTGSLAKMGQDLALLGQSEIGEAGDGSGGVSSTMPHKSNPVPSETLVAIGRMNANLVSSMHQAAIQEHERSGSGWTLEWLALPQMAVLTGASLLHALAVTDSLTVNTENLQRNVERSHGLILAEAAAFALAAHMPLSEARNTVAVASRTALRSSESLIDILERETDANIDWTALRNPANRLGSAIALIDRAIESAKGDHG
jgi:3-carboxy-cis,cis-muconate cycloisomerase